VNSVVRRWSFVSGRSSLVVGQMPLAHAVCAGADWKHKVRSPWFVPVSSKMGSPHSFLDGAKVFSLGMRGGWFGCGESGWSGGKPRKMNGLPRRLAMAGTWPAGCLFPRQLDDVLFGSAGVTCGSFQRTGKRQGNQPARSGKRSQTADEKRPHERENVR